MSLNGNRNKGLLVEGNLGVISDVEFQGGTVMVITGTNGIIRLDITPSFLLSKLNKEEKQNGE